MNDGSTSSLLLVLMPVPSAFTISTHTRPTDSNPGFAKAR